jgi:hypothetical protein
MYLFKNKLHAGVELALRVYGQLLESGDEGGQLLRRQLVQDGAHLKNKRFVRTSL